MKKIVELEEKSGKMIMIKVERAIVREASRWKKIRRISLITLGIVVITTIVLLVGGGGFAKNRLQTCKFSVMRDIFGYNVDVIFTPSPTSPIRDGNLEANSPSDKRKVEALIKSIPGRMDELDRLLDLGLDLESFGLDFEEEFLMKFSWPIRKPEVLELVVNEMESKGTLALPKYQCNSAYTQYINTIYTRVEPFITELQERSYFLEKLLSDSDTAYKKELKAPIQGVLDELRGVERKAIILSNDRVRFLINRMKITDRVGKLPLQDCQTEMKYLEAEEFHRLRNVLKEIWQCYIAMKNIGKRWQEIVGSE